MSHEVNDYAYQDMRANRKEAQKKLAEIKKSRQGKSFTFKRIDKRTWVEVEGAES